VIQQALRAMRAVGSPAYPSDEDEVAARAGRAYDRSYDPIGTARQAIATVASGDRTQRLRNLQVPTLVIHGLADRMCDVSGGAQRLKPYRRRTFADRWNGSRHASRLAIPPRNPHRGFCAASGWLLNRQFS